MSTPRLYIAFFFFCAIISVCHTFRVWTISRRTTNCRHSFFAVKNENNGNSSSIFGMDLKPPVPDSNSGSGKNIARIPMSETDLRAMMSESGGEQSGFALQGRNLAGSSSANRYFQMVDKLAPNEMLLKFAATAPSNVQEAAKSTIMNILGSLPQYALDASLLTTNTKLANLMFQMQITGYMFKNAEYRMSLTRSLKGYPKLPQASKVSDGNSTVTLTPMASSFDLQQLQQQSAGNPLSLSSDSGSVSSTLTPRFEGDVTVRGPQGETITVPVREVTDALLKEVEALRSELVAVRQAKEPDLRGNMLTYIQALPDSDMSKLTSDMGQDVMDAIQLLVDSLMSRLGIASRDQEVLIQQPMGALAQLCMWQMVVGYKLRELEALEKGVAMD